MANQQGGGTGRLIDPSNKEGGTASHGVPSGGTHVESPSRAEPRTGLAGRRDEGPLDGGKTPEQIRGYVEGVTYPANKEDLLRAAYRNHAPAEVIAGLTVLSRSHYASFEDAMSDYPGLPTEDDVAAGRS